MKQVPAKERRKKEMEKVLALLPIFVFVTFLCQLKKAKLFLGAKTLFQTNLERLGARVCYWGPIF